MAKAQKAKQFKTGDLVAFVNREGQFVQLFSPGKIVSSEGGESIINCELRVQNKFIEAIQEQLCCSFCGKKQDEVKRLVAGPSVYICNECLDVCNEMVEKDK